MDKIALREAVSDLIQDITLTIDSVADNRTLKLLRRAMIILTQVIEEGIRNERS